MISKVFFLAGLAGLANGDVYMHNPRGSNDRNCERNANRNNGNRLFDSQNNNAGGYACPRGVGDQNFQNEMGEFTFSIPSEAGTTSYTQSKRMYYYEKSVLPIEWTNQHGCGFNSNVECEIILQYACEDTLDPRVDDFWPWVQNKAEAGTTYRGTQHFRSGNNIAAPRDGVPRDSNDDATDTIPDNEASAIPNTVETRRFGMHESYDHYQLCQRTERNKGLYTADQNVRRNDRRGTRQNPNGNRQGFECPEERDYYPWWAPSPWVDVAVLSDQAKDNEVCYKTTAGCSYRCSYYMQNSMNFNSKGYCDVDHSNAASTVQTKLTSQAWQQNRWYNNNASCYKAGFRWYQVSHSDNLALSTNDFVCAKTQYARSNQLGNAMGDVVSETISTGILGDHAVHGVNANRFIWQIPTIPTATAGASYFSSMSNAYKSCSLRMRYNISTGDFQQWPSAANAPGAERMVDSRNNSKSFDDPNTPLLQDPYIYIGNDTTRGEMFLSLAVNTNQYGRTFQDRSYSFSIKKLPATNQAASNMLDTPSVDVTTINANIAAGGKIYNVNVRGKRGNIVQTYPSVEYDFSPNALKLETKDMIHFQWTGSDYNPRRGCNNGEGGPPDLNTYVDATNANQNSRADRSNVVLQDVMSANVPKDYLGYDHTSSTNTSAEKMQLQMDAVLLNAPCALSSSTTAVKQQCYDTLMRLAYLNQQKDGGSLILRQGRNCLTQGQLDAILDQENTAQNHPLNCAKLNAKPFPYFDGGIMFMKNTGYFPFFSSRNNNFSNRDQKGVICVGGSCVTNTVSGLTLLQQPPSYLQGAATVATKTPARVSKTTCQDTLNSGVGSNSNGAQSCISSTTNFTLKSETFTVQEGDNDNKGDGNKKGCEVLSNVLTPGVNTIEQQIALAIILLFVGLFVAWLAYFLYNRWQASKEGDSKFRESTAWTGAGAAGVFQMVNPFKKTPNNEAIV